MIHRVVIAMQAEKQLRKVPDHVQTKLLAWAAAVREQGLEEVRKLPGFHDEPLKGKRAGQRSIRLSLHYRAIYEVRHATIEFVSIEDVTKHKY